jgi:hypothetical protein
MAFLQRRDRGSRNGHANDVSGEGTVKGDFAAIAEFVSMGSWEDGTPRVPGTLLVCTGDGAWRAWLNDRDGEVAAWTSADTLQGLLEAVETGLREGSLTWRPTAKRSPGKK